MGRRPDRWRHVRLSVGFAVWLGAIARLQAAPAGLPLELDSERSSLEVQVQTNFNTFHGTMPRFHADIRVDPERQQVVQAAVHFAFADLKTGIALRDRHMREWQDVDHYPEVSFRLDSIEPAPGNRVLVHGGLILHGIEHAISVPVSLLVAGPVYAIDGEVEIDYRDFGLPVIHRFWFVTVEPRLVVRFHLQGRLVADPAAT